MAAALTFGIGGRQAAATPAVAITAETLGQQFQTAAASGSYAHAVPATGSNLALVVTVGTTNSVVSVASVQWDPDTTISGNEQAMSCPAANQVTMGTNRKLAICTLLTPTPSSGNGQITITFSGGTDSFTSGAVTFSGISGLRTATTSGSGKTFSTWTACTAGTNNYTCSLSATTSTDDVVFDLVGQGEQALPSGVRTFTPGSAQTKLDDSPTLTSAPHLRIATSTAIATGSSTTMTWTYGNATTTNGVGQVILPMIPASTVTAARLGRRSAVRVRGGGTRVSWETEEEASHLGFMVWRERAGRRTRVGSGLIPGSTFTTGAQPMGGHRAYEAWDEGGRPGDRYWLEEIAAHGPSRWHGPIAPASALEHDGWRPRARPAPTVEAAPVEAASVAPAVPRPPLPGPTPASACANPAAWGPAVKITVSAAGWYGVAAADLTAAGLPADVDPARLALWADGQPVGFRALGAGTLAGIEFYGQAPDTRETGSRVYWLTWTGGGGRSIPSLPAAPDGGAAPVVDSSPAEVTLRERTLYFAALLNGPADNFFGAIVSSAPVTESVAVPDPLPGASASLVVALQGATADAHQVDVSLNGVALGSVVWSGQTPVSQELAVPADLLVDGANSVLLSPATSSGVALVDHLTVRYRRPLRAVGDQLEAAVPAGARLMLGGFGAPDVRAFDVTDPDAPVELTGVASADGDGAGLAVQLPAAGGPTRIIRARSSAGLRQPDAIAPNAPSAICQRAGAEVAVVAPRSFFDALAPWVAARQAAGWSVEVIDVDDLFDEMTYGAHHAAALTDLVRLRRAGSTPRTKYLLLVGAASVDPRNFLGKNVPDLVPTALIDTDAIETASDEALADLDGDGVAELAVGRWPARTADEVAALVTATLAFDGRAPFERGSLIVTGTDGDPAFAASAAALAATLPPGPPVDRYDPSGLAADAATAGLVAHWSASPSFVQYFGHGSQQVWEGLLSADGVDALGQGGRRAVVSAMTCLNGLFHDVYQDCLASRLMRAPSGAVAVWASADLYDAGAQGALAASFAAGARTMALGAAAHAARLATGGAGRAMIFFGDPTLFGAPSPAAAGTDGEGAADGGGPSDGGASPPPPPAETPGSAGGCSLGGAPRGAGIWFALLGALVWGRRRRRARR